MNLLRAKTNNIKSFAFKDFIKLKKKSRHKMSKTQIIYIYNLGFMGLMLCDELKLSYNKISSTQNDMGLEQFFKRYTINKKVPYMSTINEMPVHTMITTTNNQRTSVDK